MSARLYPLADARTQWWETDYARGSFPRIDKILFHTTETTGWPGYKAGAAAPTLTYHPRLRAWRQHNYLDRSARALVDPTSTPVRENRDNVIQVEIIAYSDEKLARTVGGLPVSQLTDDQLGDLAAFVAFVRREWGGPPLAFRPRSEPRMTSAQYDAFAGLCGHDDASGNTHWDPGALDFDRILELATPTKPSPISPTPAAPTDQQEDPMDTKLAATLKEASARIMGFLRQRYYTQDATGAVTVVDAKAKGAKPARALDNLDGARLDRKLDQVLAALAAHDTRDTTQEQA